MRHLINMSTAVLELTLACPRRCITCGSSAGVARPDELTTEEWLAVVDDLAALDCGRLTLSGGEPLLHPGWADIVRSATSRGVGTDMITSGAGVDADLAAAMRGAGLTSVTVSVDGRGDDHDLLRGVDGSYAEALQAIGCLDAAGVKVGVSTQVNRRTLDTLDDLGDDLERAGAIGWQLQLTMPAGRARSRADELVLSPAEMPKVLETLRRLVRRPRLRPAVTDNIGYLTADDALLRTPPRFAARVWLGCFAGIRSVAVTSNGGVKACLSLPDSFIEGNVRERSLAEIWKSPDLFAWNRDYTPDQLEGACAECDVARLCRGGCTAMAVAAHGKPRVNTHCFRLSCPDRSGAGAPLFHKRGGPTNN